MSEVLPTTHRDRNKRLKEELCKRLLNDRSFRTLANRFGDPDDIIQEVALIICQKNEEQLKKLDTYFNFWVARMIMNMNSSTGQLGKVKKEYTITPREDTHLLEDKYYNPDFFGMSEKRGHVWHDGEEYDFSIDELIESVETELEKMHWYDKGLFLTYLECGSLRKTEARVNIPYSSVNNTVNKVRNYIKDKLT